MEPLKPQDVLVVLKLCVAPVPRPALAVLGVQLGMSASEVHAAIRRALSAGLLSLSAVPLSVASKSPMRFRMLPPVTERPDTTAIVEFLIHGVRYVFPATRGELTRGIPTSYAARPLKSLAARGSDPMPVWPWSKGPARGFAFEPLYRTAPFAALQDKRLYELLAITDALREGGAARERKLAERALEQRLAKVPR